MNRINNKLEIHILVPNVILETHFMLKKFSILKDSLLLFVKVKAAKIKYSVLNVRNL